MMNTSFRFDDVSDHKTKISSRQKIIKELRSGDFVHLFAYGFDQERVGSKNCENLIGSVEVPVGIVGPVEVDGEELLIPLATSEGALVASVGRGVKVINQSGGVSVFVKKVGMSRAPVFQLENGGKALEFVEWLESQRDQIKKVCESTSNHLQFLSFNTWVRGRNAYVRFVFDTDEAMGMNMVTIALKKVWDDVISTFDNVKMLSISSNVCTDKKDSMVNRLLGRGYWVQVETIIPHEIVKETLKIAAKDIVKTHVAKNLVGSDVAGSLSQNMHVANMAAAVFLATGQDMAHVVEAAQASTTVEEVEDGLYVSLTMPNVNVGTVGGGTWLEAQAQARSLVKKDGKLSSTELAGVVGIASLAGEISGLAALASGSLASAHQRLGR